MAELNESFSESPDGRREIATEVIIVSTKKVENLVACFYAVDPVRTAYILQ